MAKLRDQVADTLTHPSIALHSASCSSSHLVPSSLYGTIHYSDGSRYFGTLQNGVRHGWGIWKTRKLAYACFWAHDKKEGLGYVVHRDRVFQISFINDRICNAVTITYANGDVYTGPILNWRASGNGVLNCANGDIYYGSFVNDRISGYGTVITTFGEKYYGYFSKGQRHGRGICLMHGNSRYVGEWVHDRMHGEGRMVFQNGSFYSGQWQDGFCHGQGRFVGHLPIGDGQVKTEYVGGFIFNLFDGRGVMTNAHVFDGAPMEATWENGFLVSAIQVTVRGFTFVLDRDHEGLGLNRPS